MRAAREMRERAMALVGPAARNVMIRTFHSAALALLRESLPQYPEAGRGRHFAIADPNAQLALINWERVAECLAQTDRYVNRLTAETWKRYEEKVKLLAGERRNVMAVGDEEPGGGAAPVLRDHHPGNGAALPHRRPGPGGAGRV